MKENAILLTAGMLDTSNAKTAHGLIRTSARYNITAVIDKPCAGRDAGEVLDKKNRNIPVFASVEEFAGGSHQKAMYAIIGIALPGGVLPPEMLEDIKAAIAAGMSIVSGLHRFLNDIPELVELAGRYDVKLIDIRKPRPKEQLKFWTGEIYTIPAKVIAVLGTDCAIGKRTTCVLAMEASRSAGLKAEMIFTGQTGWLQGHKYGFILDTTYNDFVSGELENAVVTCYKETGADVIFIEGQSSLCNPSGPCGAEALLSAQSKGVVLLHAPARIYFEGREEEKIEISLEREIGLIQLYGSKVLAIALNTEHLTIEEALAYKEKYRQQFGIPVVLPLEEGGAELAGIIKNYVRP
ncbi:MAG TPA: DUF1611 domain-containing protein [Chitinophagaceae bacterium]|nr:DUF1611 domain-containing protein [Chitinophagaceae bacterium]